MDDGTMIGALRNVVRPPDLDRLMNDAAAEIERLRVALKDIGDMADDFQPDDSAWVICQKARDALGR